RRSSCTSPRRQSAGARRSRHVGRDSPWPTWCEMPRAALGVAAVRAARNMPPVISTIVMLRLICAASAHVNVSVLYQFVDTAKPPWPTSVAPRRLSFGRAARGSVAPRKMACRPAAGERIIAVQGHRPALEGQPPRCPFPIGSGNGRQDTRPCSAHRLVALLRRRRLDFGLPNFGFGLFCAWSSRSRHSLGGALRWTS